MKTNLKIITVVLAFFLLGISKITAQGNCGIYLNAENFTKGKLSHADKHTRIKIHETFKKDLVEVKCRDTAITYKKAEIFGYCDKEGSCYRFFNNEKYPILNPGETILFYKTTAGIDTKDTKAVDTYYFSKDAASPVMLLTLRNVEKALVNNEIFLKELEIHFNDESNLLEYDRIHKMYKLNRLLELAKEKKIN